MDDEEIIEETEEEVDGSEFYIDGSNSNDPNTVDWQSRDIEQADDIGTVGVTSDELARALKFRAPRFYKGTDLSSFTFRINYQNAEGTPDIHLITDMYFDDEWLYFTWPLSRLVTVVAGTVEFTVCGMRYAEDGVTIVQEINTRIGLLEINQGFEVDDPTDFAEKLDWLLEWLKPIEDAEAERKEAEAGRESAENDRVTAENSRVQADIDRAIWLQEQMDLVKAELYTYGRNIEAVPWEPDVRYHGKIWLETDENTGRIIAIRRWDEYTLGSGIYPSPELYPSDDVFPTTTENFGLFPSEDVYPSDELYPLDGKWTELYYSTGSGGEGGTSDYNFLINKPQLNSVELKGNKSLGDIGFNKATSSEINALFE